MVIIGLSLYHLPVFLNAFDITLRAYDLSEKYRVPVILLMDEVIGHMREKIELPDNYDHIPHVERKKPTCKPEDFKAFATDDSLVPPMPPFGSGYRWHVTGLVHDETGFPKEHSGRYRSSSRSSA
jgi:2-oxoglutarate ferredoxin oxidoreductase subunit alpha